jgi:hypothetical protein
MFHQATTFFETEKTFLRLSEPIWKKLENEIEPVRAMYEAFGEKIKWNTENKTWNYCAFPLVSGGSKRLCAWKAVQMAEKCPELVNILKHKLILEETSTEDHSKTKC